MAALFAFINRVRQKKQHEHEAMGQSRGGLSTKIHVAVDALGNPIRFLLTAGQHSEIKQANSLIEGFSADYIIADKGYDADAFIVAIEAGEAIAVIPPKKNRKTARDYDEHLYCERNFGRESLPKVKTLSPKLPLVMNAWRPLIRQC